MSRVFVSYNRTSEAAVRSLVNDLEALGHDVWFDQDLTGGQAWWDRILETVRNCDVFVFALAPESLDSTACDREYRYAAELGKPILPVLVAEGVSPNLLPPALSAIQLLDYRDPENRETPLSLARSITTLPAAGPLPDPLPKPPDVPISYLSDLTERVASPETLSLQDQIVLVDDLKRGLRDSETTDGARTLLERLRKRPDLFARAADDIDELLPPTPAAVGGDGPSDATDLTYDEPPSGTESTDGQELATTEKARRPTSTGTEPPDSETPSTASDLPVRSFVSLFDRRRYGISVQVGLGVLAAHAMHRFVMAVVFGRPALFLLADLLVFGAVQAAAFVALCSMLRKDWLLPLSFGAFCFLDGLVGRWVLASTIGSTRPMIGRLPMFHDFLFPGLLMVGLILAVRLFGARSWSLALGGALSRVVALLVSGLALSPLPNALLSIAFGALWGAFVHAGLFLQLRNRGFTLSEGRILPLQRLTR